MTLKLTTKKVKVFLAGALLTALAATSVTSLLSIGAAATTIDVVVSVAGGLFAVTQS